MNKKTKRKKTGPKPTRGRRRCQLMLDGELADWGMRQPNGLSETVRELLKKAKAEADKLED